MTEMAVFYHNNKGVESHSLQIDRFILDAFGGVGTFTSKYFYISAGSLNNFNLIVINQKRSA